MKTKYLKNKIILTGLLLCLTVPFQALDLSKSEDNLEAFAKLRCSLDEEEVITWWAGTIFAKIANQKTKALMKFEGYNICRMIPQEDGGYDFVSREVTYYQDLKTGNIIEQWDNPFNNKKVKIVQVSNDPVNNKYPSPKKVPYKFPWRIAGDNMMLTLDIPLLYPNALQPEEYPAESSGKNYIASEHFSFLGKLSEANNPEIKNSSLTFSWFRVGPWLPWMEMGLTEGSLLYSAQGMKLKNGFADLPESIQAYTTKNYPKYTTAPNEFYGPNETSWTHYKKLKSMNNKAQ